MAHREIWRRFVTKHGVLLDYTALDGRVALPTPEEYREGKPNALGWWTPTENGAMHGGMYLAGLFKRQGEQPTPEQAAKIRRLVQGLERLGTVSSTPGFAARGLSVDGKSCPLLSSTDQFFPWFLGLWRYWRSPLASSTERARIARALQRAMNGLRDNGYRVPTPASLGSGELGLGLDSFLPLDNEQAPRLLCLLRATYEVTQDKAWLDLYREHLPARREHLAHGWPAAERWSAWTSVSPCLALEAIHELERENSCLEGLRRAAMGAEARLRPALERPFQYDLKFDLDWRQMNQAWKPQSSKQEARAVAQKQLDIYNRISPRWTEERNHAGEPLHLAWMLSLAPQGGYNDLIERTVKRYDYRRLHVVRFFAAECAWATVKL